jgi:anti-sigma regulatory factor (Ser/Thr protein kinase)
MFYSKNLIIKNELNELDIIVEILEEIENSFFITQKNIYEINLVLDEILTNIINYGYNDLNEHFITININIFNDQFECEIIDTAKEFNPLKIKNSDIIKNLDDKKIGGLGFFFVKQKVDNIIYKREENRNILKFFKKLDFIKKSEK